MSLRCRLGIDDMVLDHVRVESFSVRECLSSSYRVRVELRSREAAITEALLDKRAFLLIAWEERSERRFLHGVILSVRSEELIHGFYRSWIEIGSPLEWLKFGREHRIFQDLTVAEITTEVLSGPCGALSLDGDFTFDLVGECPKRAYSVQANESDYDFLRRLLAAEGIGFALRNEELGVQLVFFDDSATMAPAAAQPVLFFRGGRDEFAYALFDAHENHYATSDCVHLRDYDPEQAGQPLDAILAESPESTLEIYRHPGGFTGPNTGLRNAQRLLEHLQLRRHTITGSSDSPHLEPGRRITIAGHPRDVINRDYLILSVSHEWRCDSDRTRGYRNVFEAAPLEACFRPEELPAPIASVELAMVAGASGAELHGHESGGVKVRFPWDRSGRVDDTASTWCRVGQLPLPNSMVIPRVGFEVLVDSLLGDIDRPILTGHLYNAAAPVPYELPGNLATSSIRSNSTAKGAGSNELCMNDTAGAEEISLNGSRDTDWHAENDAKLDVGNDENITIGSNHTETIGGHRTRSVGLDRKLDVGANQNVSVNADYSETIGGVDTLSVHGARQWAVGGDLTEDVRGTLTRAVGGLSAVVGIVGLNRRVIGNSKVSVGGLWTDLVGASISSTCGLLRTELVGALKLTKAKTVAIDCGVAYVQNCVSESVKVGGSRTDNTALNFNLNALGGMSIKATNINVSAEKELCVTVGKTSIRLTPSSVKIDSTKVIKAGVKTLTSTSKHGSGP